MSKKSPFVHRPPARQSPPAQTFRFVGSSAGRKEIFVSAEIDSGSPELVPARRPLYVWSSILIGCGIFLFSQLFFLQIVEGERYVGLANGNRIRETITYAKRGTIYDRHGVVLARNDASFQLSAQPYLLPASQAERERLYGSVGQLTGERAEVIKARAESKGPAAVEPVVVKERLSKEQALALEEKQLELPGFEVNAIPVRSYQSDSGLSHVLGYTARVDETELSERVDLLPIDFVGKDGVELQYDSVLRGVNGVMQTEVDALGKPIRLLRQESAQSGRDISLTIDAGLQRQLAAALAEQMQKAQVKRGAAVIIDPQTGEVLASVSLPAYDNNLFAQGISQSQYQALTADPLEPLHNKVIGGAYPSGSVIKPMHLAAALQEGIVNERTVIVDRGQIAIQSPYDPGVSYIFRGWRLSGLGPMDARRAIAMSSDIYFYHTGGGYGSFKGLGVERLNRYYQLFGMGAPTGIDLPGETAGRLPTPEWLEQQYGRPWSVGDTYNISIGQGDLLASPLQMAVATAAVANGGKVLRPHLLKSDTTQVRRERFIEPDYLTIIREGMAQVIGGTTCSCTFASVPVKVAGKSGTAETDPLTKRKPHAWYTAFAPYDNPEIVAAVILEEGEGGSQFAAPVIARALEWYFKNR